MHIILTLRKSILAGAALAQAASLYSIVSPEAQAAPPLRIQRKIAQIPTPVATEGGGGELSLKRPSQSQWQIPGLSFDATSLPLHTDAPCPSGKQCITIRGTLENPKIGLAVQTSKSRTTLIPAGAAKRTFKFLMPIQTNTASLKLVTLGQGLSEKTETITFTRSSVSTSYRSQSADLSGARNTIVPSLGPSFISYSQSGHSDVSLTVLTLKTNYSRRVAIDNVPLNLHANIFGTAATLSTSRTDNTDIRFIGLNGRVGYPILIKNSSWVIEPAFGLYYHTMIVTQDRLGFENAKGPQFLVSGSRPLNSQHHLGGYLKYALLAEKVFPSSLSDGEFALGANWSMKLPTNGSDAHRLSAGFDFSRLSFSPGTDQIRSTSFSLNVGYSYQW